MPKVVYFLASLCYFVHVIDYSNNRFLVPQEKYFHSYNSYTFKINFLFKVEAFHYSLLSRKLLILN